MKKILLGLMALFLAGCAGKPPPMPVDVNPSKALQFARAMDLRLITDAGDDYFIYNYFDKNGGAYPLTKPVTAKEKGDVLTKGDDLVFSAAAGLLTGSFAFGLTDFLTSPSRHLYLFDEGLINVSSWNTLDENKNLKEITDIVMRTYNIMNKNNSLPDCKISDITGIVTKQPNKARDNLLDIDFNSLPQPPINVSGKTKIVGLSGCFHLQAQKSVNLPVIQKMSTELGPERAIFIPGSPEHEPVVYHNGEALYFRN